MVLIIMASKKMDFEKIYDASPVWMQNLMMSIKGYQIKKRRYNKDFYRTFNAFKNGTIDSNKQLLFFLKKVRNTPAYKHILTDEFFNKVNEQNVKQMVTESFPIISKRDVKEHLDDYKNPNVDEPLFLMRTSGTTGGALVFPYTVTMENRQWSVWWRYREGLGIKYGTWDAEFAGLRIMSPNKYKKPYWRVDKPEHRVLFSSYHLNEDTVKDYYDEFVRRKVEWIHGYTSYIAKFAALVIDKKLLPLDFVKFVTTAAENQIGNQMLLVKKAFPNAIIRQHYGQMEGVAGFREDIDGNWQMDDDFSYIELIPTGDGDECQIIGTSFSNIAFPLIRYYTGDLATVAKDDEGKLQVKRIDGRSSNSIKCPNGGEIKEVHLSVMLHDFNNIIEAQFHQKSLTDVELWIVRNTEYGEADEQQLRQNMASYFDSSMVVSIKYVDSIQRTARGKLPVVVNEMNS